MSNPTILLVEDNEDDVYAFKWSAKKAPMDCPLQVVSDGKQALAYLSGEAPYADRSEFPLPFMVFLDLKLPYLNGPELLDWMQRQSNLKEIPVVILSGSDEPRDRESTSLLGAQGYLVKPVEPAELSKVVAANLPKCVPNTGAYAS